MSNLLTELKNRGFIEAQTDPRIEEMLEKESFTLYCGFDPTADSLHIGSLLPIIALRHFQKHRHKPIVVMGGGTGMIGDPSGKSSERNLLSEEALSKNIAGMKSQLERFLDFGDSDNSAIVVNNADWLNSWRLIDWLRDVGKHFPLTTMLAKDSVKSRLERESGISYTEFSYQVLQSYDFYHLFTNHNCKMQVGGGDQWGNITAGIDFIKRKLGSDKEAFGLMFPLLTTSSGQKFGKSEQGNIWLDSNRTSYYDFYQYFMRTDDKDVIKHLKLFTDLPLTEIEKIKKEHESAPECRVAHKKLADEVTKMVHGEKGLKSSVGATKILFRKPGEKLSEADLLCSFKDVKSSEVERELLKEGLKIVEALKLSKLAKSKREAIRMISQGGIYINDQKILDAEKILTEEDLTTDTIMLLRCGKKNYAMLKFK